MPYWYSPAASSSAYLRRPRGWGWGGQRGGGGRARDEGRRKGGGGPGHASVEGRHGKEGGRLHLQARLVAPQADGSWQNCSCC